MNELSSEWRLFQDRVQQRASRENNAGSMTIVVTPSGMKGPELPPGHEWEEAAKKSKRGRLDLFCEPRFESGRPSTTMRIFSSAENFRRVFLRISLMMFFSMSILLLNGFTY